MKLLITLGFFAGIIAAIIWSISSYLVVDDLKDCTAPDQLSSKCAPANAIIAISGGDTSARTGEAIKLYKLGWAPKLIFSGAALDTSGPSNAESMRSQALRAGVPAGDIILDTKAVDTTQNAKDVMSLLNTGDRRVILVTSPYHQRRASIEFQYALGNNVTVISHPTPDDASWGPYWWTSPVGWWLGISETVKAMVVSVWH